VPWLQAKETKFNGSGRESPKTIPVAVPGPRFVTVIVKVMFSPILTLVRLATLVIRRSWAVAG
jgi:hypothetical protein